MIGDLTTLARVKAFLGITNTNSDALLSSLISGISAVVLNYVGRATFGVQNFEDVYDGTGKPFCVLRQWPVVSVSKVEFCGVSLTAPADSTSWPPTNGYTIEEAETVGGAQQRLTLWGYCFPRDRSSVRVSYSAGYRTLNEARTVPAGAAYTIDPNLVWISDLGVTYANGTALTKVASSPAAGQYAVSDGIYQFASADAGAAVLLSYSSVPTDVDLAVQESVAEVFRKKDRIGIVTQSVGGQESVTYSQKDMSDRIKTSLNPFRRVTPT